MSRLLGGLGGGQKAPQVFPLPSQVPRIGGLVRVAGVDEEHWLGVDGRSSRVEDLDSDAVAVAAPRGRGDVEPPQDGEEVELRWPSGRGVFGLRVRIVERYRDGVALWWCEPVGPLLTVQRRTFVRARASGGRIHVALSLRDDEDEAADGSIVDLSEGGLRASVGGWRGAKDESAVVDVRLTAPSAFGDDGEPTGFDEHEMTGTVLRWLPPTITEPGRDLADVCVEFWQPVVNADALRSVVFAWQRAARRRAAD